MLAFLAAPNAHPELAKLQINSERGERSVDWESAAPYQHPIRIHRNRVNLNIAMAVAVEILGSSDFRDSLELAHTPSMIISSPERSSNLQSAPNAAGPGTVRTSQLAAGAVSAECVGKPAGYGNFGRMFDMALHAEAVDGDDGDAAAVSGSHTFFGGM